MVVMDQHTQPQLLHQISVVRGYFKIGRKRNAVQFTGILKVLVVRSMRNYNSRSSRHDGGTTTEVTLTHSPVSGPSSLSATSTQESRDFGRRLVIFRPSQPLESNEKRRNSSAAFTKLHILARRIDTVGENIF